jgi:hypothetical protein
VIAFAIPRRRSDAHDLAGGSVGRRELRVRGGPNAFNAAARANEKGRRCQRYERHQKRILDQVLALLVCCEVPDNRFHLYALLEKLLCLWFCDLTTKADAWLAGRGISRSELRVGGVPNAFNAAACANEQGRGRQLRMPSKTYTQ